MMMSLLLTLAMPVAAGGNGNGSNSVVNEYYGSFGTEVPIVVPHFHGLEPSVRLVYNSTSGNGVLGVGWQLSGDSIIKRGTSPGGGSPQFNSSDVFYLDGQELVPDSSMGGDYSTRIKNYARIEKDEGANRWYVTGTNGNVATYKPVYVVGSGFNNVYYWGLESIEDPHGNTVYYDHWCDPGKDCYLDDITYNGTEVKFYYEGRSHNISFGNGSYMGGMRYRLRSIAVRVDGQLARAYKLDYNTSSSSTERPLLTNVQQCGRDASVDGSGNVSGGTCLPAMDFGYSPERGHDYHSSPISEGAIDSAELILEGDFTGEGRSDLLFMEWDYPNGGFNDFYLSRGNGSFDHWNDPIDGSDFVIETPSYVAPTWMVTGDFNGDGLSDLASFWGDDGTNRFHLSNGNGTFSEWDDPIPTGRIDNNPTMTRVGDFNGDGLSDIFTYWKGSGTNRFHLSNGDGTFTYWSNPIPTGGIDNATRVMIADFNGDGRGDFLFWFSSGTNRFRLSHGDGTFTSWNNPISGSQLQNSDAIRGGDFNGDGIIDLFSYWNNGTNRFHLSHGDWAGDPSFSYWSNPIGKTAIDESADQIRVADFNGDGLSDLLFYWDDGRNRFYLSQGDNNFEYWGSPHNEDAVDHADDLFVGDYDGDGMNDQGFFWDGNGRNRFFFTQGPIPDLLTDIDNGIGGSTEVNYTPSSAWDNTMMPAGMIVQTTSRLKTCDGRGHCDTTDYSYEGGLWSWAERRFLGFRKATSVLASDGSYTEIYYWQSEGSTSKPEITYFRDNNGNIFSYSKFEYAENSSPPYTSNLVKRWNYQCNQTQTCWRGLTEMSYDVYGNVIQTKEWGDYDLSGDERTTVRGYNANTSKHITALPAYENVYEGLGTGGTLLQRVRYVYDSNSDHTQPPTKGKLAAEQLWADPGYVERSFSHDAWGNTVSETDPLGNTTTHTFDGAYHLYETETCNPDNRCTTQSWDYVLGRVTSATDPNGTTVNTSYDALGRQTSETWPHNGATITTEYLSWGNPNSQRVRVTQPDGTGDGLWTELYRDGLGRVYKEVSEGGTRVETIYSGTSERVWKKSLPYDPGEGESARWTVHTYDGALRPRETFNPDDSSAEVIYYMDDNGKPSVGQYDENGNFTMTWRDAYGQLIQVRESDELWNPWYYTTYEYDMLGQLTRIVDEEGNQMTFTYDALGRKTSINDPDMGTWTYTYDDAGNLLTQTDAKGQTITYSYDDLGRPTTKTYPGGEQVNWYYDESGHGASIGRLTRKVFPGGSESYTYDEQGNVTEATRCVDGVCKTMQTTYDAMDRVTSQTYPDGETVTYAYNSEGYVSSASGLVNSITYNSRGQIETLTYANGTQTTYDYNDDRAWLDTAEVKKGGATLFKAIYWYAPNALVWGIQSTAGDRAYGHDDMARLTADGSPGGTEYYAYDPIGNITSGPAGDYSYGAGSAGPHAVTSVGGNDYSYDANGNMTSGAGRSMTWNADNMLTSVTSDGTTTEYTYDGGEGRVKKVVGGSDVTRYFGIVEDHNGTLIKHYSVGGILVARQEGSTREWYHSDRLGSIVKMTDASGNVIQSYDYTAFGEFIEQSGSSTNDATYTGHRFDEESGLIYMGARYYDPELGRFISPDTIVPDPGNSQALNRYSYVYNSPVSNTDPSGHLPVAAAVVGVAIGAATGVLAGTMLAVAVIGAACTVAGYALKSPILMSVGAVLTGYVNGGALGATVAAMTSPVSPLDPGLKQAIGWAYTAYGLIKSMSQAGKSTQQQSTRSRTARAKLDICGAGGHCTDGTVEVEMIHDSDNLRISKTTGRNLTNKALGVDPDGSIGVSVGKTALEQAEIIELLPGEDFNSGYDLFGLELKGTAYQDMHLYGATLYSPGEGLTLNLARPRIAEFGGQFEAAVSVGPLVAQAAVGVDFVPVGNSVIPIPVQEVGFGVNFDTLSQNLGAWSHGLHRAPVGPLTNSSPQAVGSPYQTQLTSH